MHVYDINKYFYGLGGGVRQSIGYQELKNMVIPIPPEEIVEFASLIPHMDKDVAIAIINQFPAYVESSRNMIEQYNAMCDKVLQSNDDSRKDAVMAYKTILA